MLSRETENVVPVVVILTAIPVEYKAVKAHLDDIKEDVAENGTIYEKGVFHSDGQEWTVVIRETGAGNVTASSAVHLAWEEYQPDVMLFCGIAGGRKDVKIGDVVVASKVYYYHSGRVESNFSARPETGFPSSAIMERANLIAKNSDRDYPEIPSEPSAEKTKVLVKPIASGEELLASQDSETLKRIGEHYNDAVAIEMEGYGFLSAAQKCSVNERLLIRGISDLLEGKTETDKEGGQEIAARNAASFAFQVLGEFRPRLKMERKTLGEMRAPEKRDETTRDEGDRIAEGSISSGKIPELAVVERFRNELKKRGVYEIGVEERVRLFVLAGSLLPSDVKFNELGNHLLHRMYLNRNNEVLTSSERRLIYTTLLRDSSNYKTGWFWLRERRIKRIVKLLEEAAVSESRDDTSREGAIKILQVLEPSKAEASLVKIVKDCGHEQKRNILDYLCAHGSRKALNVVEELTVGQHEGVTSKAILAKIGILSRYDSAQTVKILVEEATKELKICKEPALKTIVSTMNTRNLRKLTAINCPYVFRELAKRGQASEAELKSMLQADGPEIQYLGYSALLKRGVKFKPVDIQNKWPKSREGVFGFLSTYYQRIGKNWLEKAVLEAYLKMPMWELEGSVELKCQSGIAYLAWGLSGGRSVVEIIRTDIKTNFKRHKANLLLKIEEAKEDTAKIKEFENIEGYRIIELTVSALKVLLKYGNAGDKVIAKTFLESEDTKVRDAAIGLFAKYAGKKDIDVLSEIASSGDVEGRIVAAKRLLKLDPGKRRSRDLLESSYSDVVKEAIYWHIANEERLDWSELSALLYSKGDEIRLLATAYAVKTWTRQKLVPLLKRYLSGETYYYDVVCWLDRVLYAPRDLAQGYKKQLIEKYG